MSPKTPFGISQYTTWPQSFEADLNLYETYGISFIEVCEAKLDRQRMEDQLRLVKDKGFQVSSVQPRLHSLFPGLSHPEPRDPAGRMVELKKTIRLFGRHFPGTTVVTISGAAPNGNYELAMRIAIQEYKAVAKEAEEAGVRVALEPLNPILMNVDTFLCSLAQARKVIAAVDHPAFGLLIDVWHIWEDAASEAEIQRSGDRIFGVHINDWRTPRAFGDRLLPGEGNIPLVKLLRAIHGTGYKGPYTMEIFSETNLEGSLWLKPEHAVEQGQRGFERLWREICD